MNNETMRVSFSGPLGSGKTTAKILVVKTLRRAGFNVPNEFGPENYLDVSFENFRPLDDVLRQAGELTT